MPESVDSLLSGVNAGFVAELYERFLRDPSSVHEGWRALFEDLPDDRRTGDGRTATGTPPAEPDGAAGPDGASPAKPRSSNGGPHPGVPEAPAAPADSTEAIRAAASRSVRARILIRSYRMLGHLEADFDPLRLKERQQHRDLDYRTYGFTSEDLDTPIFLDSHLGLAGRERATLREILTIVRQAYCSTIGVEYMHMQEVEERAWIQRRFEEVNWRSLMGPELMKAIYRDLAYAEGLESFLQVKFTGTKRFGLDGGESTIPCIEQLLVTSSALGVEEVVIGMPHRGRLNVLARTLVKPCVAIFSEFQAAPPSPEDVHGSGDVKYHLGASADRDIGGRRMHLTLTANPSHLEAVNPVALGKVRAKQALRGDEAREKVMGLLIHGDAAFAGQGIVPETLDLSQLRGYRTGGTIHVIVNNQIGFTTNPVASRSTPYPTDIAKGLHVPIFHVNGDDPEAVARVAHLAAEFRHRFKRDVVIDVFCYRRHGHNEADEPSFTQPLLYRKISGHRTTREIYRERLIGESVLTAKEADAIDADFRAHLEAEFDAAADYRLKELDWFEGQWEGLSRLEGEEERQDHDTSVDLSILKTVGRALARIPDDVHVHPKLARVLEARGQTVEEGDGIDWATAEALAFGTLLMEGTHVRLSGQDSGRGTFSQRHAVLVDQEDERRYYPLSEIAPGKQAAIEVMDSPLSEFGVVGFEYGYSLADPRALVVWEAQFGDFANGAQVIFDQFLSSGESKWLRMSGLVVLLPHGHEGQGPEHSSARLERWLQGCAQDNWQVVSCTTPANLFHVLRRQVRRNYRKPLVLMAPKSLLRHKLVVSRLGDLGPGTRFRRVMGEVDALEDDATVRRAVLCSGKVYFDLLERRRELELGDVALIRVEQLYPWPRDGIARELSRYPRAEVVWCQEEPANMGAWNFVMRRIEYILDDEAGGSRPSKRPLFVGLPASASPATGHLRVHRMEQELLVEQVLTWKSKDLQQPFKRIPEP